MCDDLLTWNFWNWNSELKHHLKIQQTPRYHRVWLVLRKFCDFGVKWSVFECILKQFIQFVSWLFQRCFAFLSSFQTSTTILFKVWFEVCFFLGGGFGRWIFESKSRRFHRDPPVESVKLMNIAVEVPLHRWMSPRWPTSSQKVDFMVQFDVFDPYENLFEKISKVAQIFIFFSCRFVISKVWSSTRVLTSVKVVSKFLKHRISSCALSNVFE